ncbi:hypothetical protein BGZ74_006389 [Mortierella antarctica]|nr:hypothetical protein BGZ74_006389 [Mortierella antarctica]
MRGARETLSSPKPSPNSDLGAQILATRTYGIYVGLYLGLVLCCDHYRLHLYTSLTILVLGFAVLWSAYPPYPTLESEQDNDEPYTPNATNSPITIDTQDAITTTDAVWSPKAPVFLISTSFPNISWTETVSPGDDPPPPYASFPTKGAHHYPPSIFRSTLSMGGLIVSLGILVYTTFIDTTHLVRPTSDIAGGIIGIVVVCCGYQLVKDMISTEPSTQPSASPAISLKGYREPTTMDKFLDTKLDITTPSQDSSEQEKGLSAVASFEDNVNDDKAAYPEPSLNPWLELALLESTSKHGEDELFGEHKLFGKEDKDEGQEQDESDETDLEQKQQQDPAKQLFLSLLELQESQERQNNKESQESMTEDPKWMLELVRCEAEDRKHPKDLHRTTRRRSFDMRAPERPLPRLVSSMSFDSFLPFFTPVEMSVNEDLLSRIAPLPEKGHKELVAIKRKQLAKRPHIQQHEQGQHVDGCTIVSRSLPLDRSQSLVSISKSNVDLFTISLFVLPSMIRRPLMLFSRSLGTTFSVHGQHNSGEMDWDVEYDIVKQGEWDAAETTPRQLQRSSTSVSLSRRPDHMKHKRGQSESSSSSTSRSRRSFFSLESDTLQSIFLFYRRRQAATLRDSSETLNDNTPVEPEEERITFVVPSNMLPTVRVGLYGTQKRMWTSTGSIVLEPEANMEARAPSGEHN